MGKTHADSEAKYDEIAESVSAMGPRVWSKAQVKIKIRSVSQGPYPPSQDLVSLNFLSTSS